MMKFNIATWKRGMTQIVNKLTGTVTPVTLLEVKPHEVFRLKTKKTDGYNAVCFSAGNYKLEKRVDKPLLKQLESKSLKPRELIFEVRLDDTAETFGLEGSTLGFDFIAEQIGSKVDATGISTGKGFSGVMKRWNFRGLEASHGVSITHRSHGSTGQRQDPGKVFKNKKMAGHYGVDKTTTQNLEIVAFDKELNLIAVKGSVPGHDGGVVYLDTAVKLTDGMVFSGINGLKVIYE